jgi:AcrR family transcriptional regulator
VRTTLPLLIEHGGTVSTSQIAAAAGIAEGTVFRAFKDKQDLLIACMQAGMNSDHEVATIERIGRDGPLAARLTEGVRAIGEYIDRIYAVGQAMRAGGVSPEAMHERMHGAEAKPEEEKAPGPPAELIRVSRAMSGLIDADTDNLRVAPERAVQMLLGLVFTNRMQGIGFGQAIDSPEEIVDLFLHGVINGNSTGSNTDRGNQP